MSEGELEKKFTYEPTTFEYQETLIIQFESPLSIGFDIPWIPLNLGDTSSRVTDPLVKSGEDIR